MSSYLQIQGDPTKWWPVQPVQASQLTGPAVPVAIRAPLFGTLLISSRAGSVALVDPGPAGVVPSDADILLESIYVPTVTGPSASGTVHELPPGTNLANLQSEIATLMSEGKSQTITVGSAISGGGVLVLNGATLPFVVLCPVHQANVLDDPSGGGVVPSDRSAGRPGPAALCQPPGQAEDPFGVAVQEQPGGLVVELEAGQVPVVSVGVGCSCRRAGYGRIMADIYATLAADYDWLFGDEVFASGEAINQPATARLLQRTGPGGAVLDASCGTGLNAAVLARRGFDVWATDGSDVMVGAAADRFRREQLTIPLARCLWADLPATLDERFDVVLCIGNSLVHAAARHAMVQALTGLRRMLRPGGHVVIDSRNWEKLHAERRIVRVADRVKTRGGRRCLSLYAWEIPDRLDQEHVAHIVFVFEDGDRAEPHEYRVSFQPFTVRDLRERLELAGLREVDTDFGEAMDRYAVTAVAT